MCNKDFGGSSRNVNASTVEGGLKNKVKNGYFFNLTSKYL